MRKISIIFLQLMNNFVQDLCFLFSLPLFLFSAGDFFSVFSNRRRWRGRAEPWSPVKPQSPTFTYKSNVNTMIFLAMIVNNRPWCWCCRPLQALVRNFFIWKKCGRCFSFSSATSTLSIWLPSPSHHPHPQHPQKNEPGSRKYIFSHQAAGPCGIASERTHSFPPSDWML